MSIEEIKQKFCVRVKGLREEQNLTTQELAERSGVPLDILEQLEQNILPKEMMVSDACELAKVFHCKTYELFQ